MARWFRASFGCWRTTTAVEVEPSCSFCSRPQSDVKRLVAGGPKPSFICDECVAVMTDILASEDPRWADERVKTLELRLAGEVVADDEKTDAKRAMPRVSKATGGLLPGVDLTSFSVIEEADDLAKLARLKRST